MKGTTNISRRFYLIVPRLHLIWRKIFSKKNDFLREIVTLLFNKLKMTIFYLGSWLEIDNNDRNYSSGGGGIAVGRSMSVTFYLYKFVSS